MDTRSRAGGAVAVALALALAGTAREAHACRDALCKDASDGSKGPTVDVGTSTGASGSDASTDDDGIGLAMDFQRSTVGDSFAKPGAAATWSVREIMHGRASRRIAFDLGVEQSFGSEAAGYHRYDVGLALPEMYFYLTPDAFVQAYTLTGFGLRFEHFEASTAETSEARIPWLDVYFGMVLGAGAEMRVGKKTSMRFELRGFLRGRIDGAHENAQLEAVNDTQRGITLSVGWIFF